MMSFVEQLIAAIWNRITQRDDGARQSTGSLEVGLRVTDGQPTRNRLALSDTRRTTHVAVLGKTGTGKSSLLRYLSAQDVEANRGFVYFDLHGDATPFLLRTIAEREKRTRQHLHEKVILVAPADPDVSIGLNPLEQETPEFVRIAEFAAILKERWHLDHFGARTDELLRNALYALSANQLTLVELAPFLSHGGFRAACLKKVENAEIRQYFELRYEQATEAMRAVMREPVLNKVSAFTADPHFRHIVGQQHSTFSLRDAMDQGHWVIVNLEKGRLGEQALTLGSLFLSVIKNALFSRANRSLYTLYCDEVQNLVADGSSLETILSEARKFGVAIVSANQFLEQHSAEMRAAILAVGTHVFFQLSSGDAQQVSHALDGGKPLSELLKNLRQRHCIVKSGPERWVEARVPTVRQPEIDVTDLLNRSRYTWGRPRGHVERDIAKRQATLNRSTDEVLDGWQ